MKKTIQLTTAMLLVGHISYPLYATTADNTKPSPLEAVAIAHNKQPTPTTKPAPTDCLYQLSSDTPITEEVVTEWARSAAIQSFDYRFDHLDTQLQKLKACYTDKGWLGFNDAMKQSGNLATIKAQQLTVSSQIEGNPKVNLFKNNQWKITIPLKVVYQNTQEKLTQNLVVEMIIAKKSVNQLGIVQIIAEPKSQSNLEERTSS